MGLQTHVYHYRELHELNELAASILTHLANAAVRDRGRFTFVLSGGNTPKPLYRLLTSPPYIERMPWAKTHVFWGDERMVPRDHKDSNYAMAFESLVSRAPLPASNIHPMPVGAADAGQNADAYEQELRQCFSQWDQERSEPAADTPVERFPAFDFVLLGMGKDGHTASLFPGSKILHERNHWVSPVEEPGLSPFVPRVTLTFPAINHARCVAFLISGPEKFEPASRILSDPDTSEEQYPAAGIRPRGRLIWFMAEREA